jgi:hypothetical protein
MIKHKLTNRLARRRFGRLAADPSAASDTCAVYGNCQAAALRILLQSSPTFPLRTVAIPAVQELTAEDADALRRILPHVAAFISQPVKAGYRDLGLGSEEMAAAVNGRVVRIVPIYYQGLHPFQVRVRLEGAESAPITLYDDLRFLYCAAKGWDLSTAAGWLASYAPSMAVIAELADESRDELERRETDLAVDVRASHHILGPAFRRQSFFTIDHPATTLLHRVAEDVCHQLGYSYRCDVTDELLGAARAPIEPRVCEALDLDVKPSYDWVIDRTVYTQEQLLCAHLDYYGARPALVRNGVAQHAERMARLDLELD